MDFFPSWNFEVAGGYLFVPEVLDGGDDSKWQLHIVGAPNIPKALGGNVSFVANNRLAYLKGRPFQLDSKLNPADINGDQVAEARRIRWIFSHPQGASTELQVNMQVFK
jgi:hypothetical protein